MGQVIMGNLKKTSEMIDPQGNIINPRTKQVVRTVDQGYQPTPEEVKSMFSKPEGGDNLSPPLEVKPEAKTENPLAEAIKAQVQKAVQEQIKNIDISKMVAEAVKDAFK